MNGLTNGLCCVNNLCARAPTHPRTSFSLPFSIFSGEKEAGALTPPSSSEAAEEDEASPRASRTRGAPAVAVAASPPSPRRVRRRTRCMLPSAVLSC